MPTWRAISSGQCVVRISPLPSEWNWDRALGIPFKAPFLPTRMEAGTHPPPCSGKGGQYVENEEQNHPNTRAKKSRKGQHQMTQSLDVDWDAGLLLTGSFDARPC